MKRALSLFLLAIVLTASGVGTAPQGVKPSQARAMARRGAILDLQKNLLRQYRKVRKGSIRGIMKHVEITDGEWDGKTYTVKGRLRLKK